MFLQDFLKLGDVLLTSFLYRLFSEKRQLVYPMYLPLLSKSPLVFKNQFCMGSVYSLYIVH